MFKDAHRKHALNEETVIQSTCVFYIAVIIRFTGHTFIFNGLPHVKIYMNILTCFL